MSRWYRTCVVVGALAAAAACASSDREGGADGQTAGSGNAGSAGMAGADPGSAGVAPVPSAGTAGGGVVVAPSDAGSDASMECAGELHVAERIPVDVFVMLDRSQSMLDSAEGGPTKWQAVAAAIGQFAEDPRSAGLEVALQYFPLRIPGVPSECRTDAECGAGAPCIKHCLGQMSAGQPIQCTEHSQCGTGMNCLPPDQPSICFREFTCSAGDYAELAAELAPLPASAGLLTSSLAEQTPAGSTPTGPALEGALARARDNAMTTSRRSVVLLATDGLPSDCSPTDNAEIAAIAERAASGSPSIPTFVIGVFGASEVEAARTTLNAIAAAGGSEAAILVEANADVANEFLTALNRIRSAVLPCEFAIPEPGAGGTVDYQRVNVEVARAGGSPELLLYVGEASECGAAGGWHYDRDPLAGEAPESIVACPATCSDFQARPDASVSIRVGCETVVQPPR